MFRISKLVVLAFSLLLATALLAGAMWRQTPSDPDAPNKQLSTMVEVYEHIADDYVTTPDLGKVSEGALHGLLESLDADSSYLDPAEYQAFLAAQQNPPKGGIEAVVSKRVGYATVVDVEPDGPATRAGLTRGDFVEAIENQGTRELSLEEIRRLLDGAPGTTVTLSVVHLHQSDPVKVTITRAAPQPASAAATMNGTVGVIAVPNFAPGRAAQIASDVKALERQGAKSLVLDLRNCGAGSYEEAEHAANLFLSQETITYLEGQKYPRVTTTAQPAEDIDPAGKLEVLVNYGTSGPAEVAAAALQQNGRAQLIGDRTFGEGSLQKLIPVGDGSAVWLSVARYYSPKGKLIQDGLTPDVMQVQYAGALPDLDFPPEGVSGVQPDLQMQRALALAAGPVQ